MSHRFQRILTPIDFSQHAGQALDYAIAWGRQLNAQLILVHVVPSLSEVGIDMAPALPAAHLERLEKELTRHMQRYLQRVEDAGVQGDLVIAHGSPLDEIIGIVKARRIDLIIMGSHGRSGLSHLLLGSMAEKVMRLAPCPVLIVR
jgi:universal stress protein A